jgi:hypothetical protein
LFNVILKGAAHRNISFFDILHRIRNNIAVLCTLNIEGGLFFFYKYFAALQLK